MVGPRIWNPERTKASCVRPVFAVLRGEDSLVPQQHKQNKNNANATPKEMKTHLTAFSPAPPYANETLPVKKIFFFAFSSGLRLRLRVCSKSVANDNNNNDNNNDNNNFVPQQRRRCAWGEGKPHPLSSPSPPFSSFLPPSCFADHRPPNSVQPKHQD